MEYVCEGWFKLLDVSAVLLILFGFLAAVSGLCLVKPEVVEGAMLGFFSSYSVCSRLHLGWTALLVIVVAVVYGVAGLDVWLLWMGRDWLWVVVLVVVFWFIYVYMAWVVGLGAEWHVVREAYRKITRVYEGANMLATLGNVDRWRREAIALFYSLNGKAALKVLDAGAGPGNMARHIKGVRYVVALDATPEMLYANDVADDKVVGVFEYMPFRDRSFDLLMAGYSLHAAMDLERAVAEFSRVAAFQCVISIGKPTNRLVRRLLLMYTKYVLPRLVCLAAPKQICGEYKKIYTIVSALPPNSKLREIVSRYAVLITFRERGFGSIYIYLSRSPNSF